LSSISLSRKPKRAKKDIVDRDKALLITSSVPVEKAFHFFTDLRKPLGIFATSIFEFADELKKVDLKSLEFHMQRNDFSKWLREVIRDDWLANEFEGLQGLKLSGEKLRARVADTAEKRCKELAEMLKGLGH
jgi:alpha-amylase